MTRSPIDFYIHKVIEGDSSALLPLCDHLAERLIYVPVANTSEDEDDTRLVIVTERENSLEKVLAFTTEEAALAWREQSHQEVEFITLFGADLCAARGEMQWLKISSQADESVELPPEFGQAIAEKNPDGPDADFRTRILTLIELIPKGEGSDTCSVVEVSESLYGPIRRKRLYLAKG